MKTNHLKAKPDDPQAPAREMMVDSLRQRGIHSAQVLAAMATIPRHCFVEDALRSKAYDDHPLPIGYQQTISQPFMVALMTELMRLDKHHRVLEIGVGSGYQTAILALLSSHVYGIDRIPQLARQAQVRLNRLNLYNAIVKAADGTVGWSGLAPFDAILVAAASPHIPPPLIDQLTIGGRLVIPVGVEKRQRLLLLIKGRETNHIEEYGGCVFVKLIGHYGWR